MSQPFRVRPLEEYSGAEYPQASVPLCRAQPDRGRLARRSRLGRAALLGVGLVIALGGCDLIEDFGRWGVTDGDIAVDYPPPCGAEESYCESDQVLIRCYPDGYGERIDCPAECAASDPNGLASGGGCDASQVEDPCQCGSPTNASPPPDPPPGSVCPIGDAYCSGAFALSTCVDGTNFETVDCQVTCREALGSADAFSGGCNIAAADPCQCALPAAPPPCDDTDPNNRCGGDHHDGT